MTAVAQVFELIPSRPPPVATHGVLPWLKRNLFSDWKNSLGTLIVLALLVKYVPPLLDWAVFNAVARPDNKACRAIGHAGACWGVVAEKYRLILFGRYPYEEQWRPLVATAMMVAPSRRVAIARSEAGSSARGSRWSRSLVLMHGGVFGLTRVDTARWGGFCRRSCCPRSASRSRSRCRSSSRSAAASRLPGIRTICVLYVELIRGVPLISVLFMASFMFRCSCRRLTIDVLVRVQVGIIPFSAAYPPKLCAAGCRRCPRADRGRSLARLVPADGTQGRACTPLRLVVPAIMNTFIGTLGDTSLVTT